MRPSTKRSLAAGFGLSRTPFREVLQRLAGEGYVALSENRGAKVSPMDLDTLRTFFQTAPLIYASIARLAAENRDAPQLVALKAAQENFVAANAAAGRRRRGDGQSPLPRCDRRNGAQPLSDGCAATDARSTTPG